jgi:peptidyl-prolyl cis-trans isomerase A (cyclophilin A)
MGILLRALAFAAAVAAGAACAPSNPRVELRTQFGAIVVEVDTARAPRTAGRFLRYVDEGRYADASFYRVRRDEAELMQETTAIVQGGLWYAADTTQMLPPIALEPTSETGLRHVDGTVSLARFGVDSGRGEFFVVVGDQPHLDHNGADSPGYAAFGRVVEGMDLMRAIQRLPVDGERLRRRIPFTARRVE